MNMKNVRVPIPGEATLLAQVREIIPAAPQASIRRLVGLGLSEHDVVRAAAIARMHQSNLAAIAVWIADDDMTLDEIEAALISRDDMAWASRWVISVRMLHRLRTECGLQTDDALETVLTTFLEAAVSLSPRMPLHRLMHRLDEVYGGDLLRAFHDADNASLFRRVLEGRVDRVTLALRQINGPYLESRELTVAHLLGCSGVSEEGPTPDEAFEAITHKAEYEGEFRA